MCADVDVQFLGQLHGLEHQALADVFGRAGAERNGGAAGAVPVLVIGASPFQQQVFRLDHGHVFRVNALTGKGLVEQAEYHLGPHTRLVEYFGDPVDIFHVGV